MCTQSMLVFGDSGKHCDFGHSGHSSQSGPLAHSGHSGHAGHAGHSGQLVPYMVF